MVNDHDAGRKTVACALEDVVDRVVIGKRQVNAVCTARCIRRIGSDLRAHALQRTRLFRRAVPHPYILAAPAQCTYESCAQQSGPEPSNHVVSLPVTRVERTGSYC